MNITRRATFTQADVYIKKASEEYEQNIQQKTLPVLGLGDDDKVEQFLRAAYKSMHCDSGEMTMIAVRPSPHRRVP